MVSKRTRMFVLEEKSKVFFIQYKKMGQFILGQFLGTKGAFHLSQLTGQPIPIVMRISLLIKNNHQDQSNPKYYVQRRWFFSKTSWKKRISLPKCLVRP